MTWAHSKSSGWSWYCSGAGDAYLGAFDPLTGHREGPGGYLYNGANIDFENVGGLAFSPGLGGDPAAVPEPTAWALMILGFGATGMALRRRRLAPSVKFA